MKRGLLLSLTEPPAASFVTSAGAALVRVYRSYAA